MKLIGRAIRNESENGRRARQLATRVLTSENRGVDVTPKDGDGREHAYRLRRDAA